MKFFSFITFVFIMRYVYSKLMKIFLNEKENENTILNDNSSSNNDFLYIFTESDSEQGEFAAIRTEINNNLFYSVENYKKNAIIIPKEIYSSIESLNINIQCNLNCNYNLSNKFVKTITIEDDEYFWFNTIDGFTYKFKINFESNYIFCLKSTYTNISNIEYNITKMNDLEILNINEINSICFYSCNYKEINFEFSITDGDDYVFIYFQENNNVIKDSIYSPIYFYYFNNHNINCDISSKNDIIQDGSSSNTHCISPCRDERIIIENNENIIFDPIDKINKYSILFDILTENNFILNDKKYDIYYNNFFIDKTDKMEFKFTDMNNKLIVFQFLLINNLKYNCFLHKLYFNKILKDRLILNEIRFYRQGQFDEDSDKYLFKINKIKGDIHVYVDICISYPDCKYDSSIFQNNKINKKNFTEIYEISNTFTYIIDSTDNKRISMIYPNLFIVECVNKICIYDVSIEKIYEEKILNLDKPFYIYNKEGIDKYSIELEKGFYLLNIYTIFGKVNVSLNNNNIIKNKSIIYLNYIILNFETNNQYNCKFEINILEDSFYYLIINKLPSEDSSIIIPGIKNLISINNKYHNLYFPKYYENFTHNCNLKVIFKPINDKIKITINNTDYDEDDENYTSLAYSYNNLHIHSFNYCDYDEVYYTVNCENYENCLYFIMIEDNNNIVLSSNYIDYFILDNELDNLKLLIPIPTNKINYYFNYFYNHDDLIIYQTFSGNYNNLTIDNDKIHNKFSIDDNYYDDNINHNYYYFYIQIFAKEIDNDKEYLLEFNLKRNSNYPTLLYSNEIYFDYFDDLIKLYYIIPLKNNSEGSFYYQIQKGCGKIFGMISSIDFTSDYITNVIIDFDEKEDYELLKFDRYNQKITFKSEEDCNNFPNKYCFLIIKITYDIKYNNNFNFGLTLMTRIKNEATYIKPEINILGNLIKRTEDVHIYEFFISKNLYDFYIIFSSNDGIIEVLNEKEEMKMGNESKIIHIDKNNYNQFIQIKISSNFQEYNIVNYKIEISSKNTTIPIICKDIYEENDYIFNFYDNSHYKNNITCFSNCEYCKIQDYNQFKNLKCVNCPPPYLSILYDNQPINQTKCLKYCTIEYFLYKNRTCQKVENYIDYCLKNSSIYRGLNFTSILYYYNNYSSNNNATIDLKECLNIINKKYEIDNNESLIIYLASLDMLEHQVTNQIEYLIFTPNETKVDLNICENESIIVSTYVNLSKTDINFGNMYYLFSKGFDIFNSSESFYIDICQHFSSENTSTDISIEDRKKLFYCKIKFCEEKCVYAGFNITTFKVNCSCPVKNRTSALEKLFIENGIDEEFESKVTSSNLKVLKCLNLLNKEIFKYNIGFYIIFAGILTEIIFTFVYYKLGIYNIMKLIENYKSANLLNKNYNEKISRFKNKVKKNSSKNYNISENVSMNPPKKKIDIVSPKFKQKFHETYFEEKETSSVKSKKEYDELIKKHYVMNEKNYKTFKFSNEQINEMNYEQSLKYDKRNILQMYYSFLMYSQLIIFTFLNKTDYNVKVLKIQLFFFAIIIFIVFNTLFYSDNDVSHTYQNKGKFDFLYTLPKTIFSSLISAVINFILKFLSLSNEKIKQIANIKNEKLFQKTIFNEILIIKRKIFVFHILIFLFILFFWLYITLFCAVYRNSQTLVFKSCLITFCLSMFYPFIICLITAVFRLFALSHNFKIFFYISKIFQLF